MPDQSFFLAFGGIGVTLAGFAGLIATLHAVPGGASPVMAYRVRTIVVLGFCLTLAGFGTAAAWTIFGGDLPTTVRVGTLLTTLPLLRGALIDTRPGPTWRSERERRVAIAVLGIMFVANLGNLVVAGIGYLQGLFLLSLFGPVTIFYNTIRDATAPAGSGRVEAGPDRG